MLCRICCFLGLSLNIRMLLGCLSVVELPACQRNASAWIASNRLIKSEPLLLSLAAVASADRFI